MNEKESGQDAVTENNLADELQVSSEIEASEQQPLEENPMQKLENELAETKDNHIRLLAEFDNYKRRNLKERAELIRTAGADTLISLLPVLDDFERALKASEQESSPLRDGVVLIHQKLIATLEQRGLKAMESVNMVFDAEKHEAITNITVEDSRKGLVVDEVEKGYLLNDKVIRYAKVIVGN